MPLRNQSHIITSSLGNVILFVFIFLVYLSAPLFPAMAQNIEHTQNTADASLRGGLQVDPSTLGMTVQIPLGEYSGRGGLNIPITLSYGSKLWRMQTLIGFEAFLGYQTQSAAMFAEHSMSGWTSSLDPPEIEFVGADQPFNFYPGDALCVVCDPLPSETPYYVNRLLIHMPDGSTHELRKSDTPVTGENLTMTGIYYAVDGSRLKYDADTATLYLPDGSRYLLAAPGGVQFIDRNGNTLSYNSTYKQWTDTLGRVIGLPPLQNSAAVDLQYWVPGFDGTNRLVTFRWRNLSAALTDSSQPLRYKGSRTCQGWPDNPATPHLFHSSQTTDSVCSGGSLFNPVVLWQIVLPNNSAYTFTYNVFGEIDKVVLPTGGYQRYRYDTVDSLSSSIPGVIPNGLANRGVVEHWVSALGDGTDEVRWQYSAVNSTENYATTVIGPNGAKSERLMHKGTSPNVAWHFGFEDARAGRAYEERTYNSSGQMIRRTLVDWTMTTTTLPSPFQYVTATSNPLAVKKVDILLDTGGGNALAAITTTGYDNDLNEISSNRYDYVSVNPTTVQTATINSFTLGTLLRTEETTFLLNDTSISQTTRDAYRARHLLSLPSFTRVKQGSTIVAETQFKYDESAYPLLTYGATPTGWIDPATTVRGNATTIRRWLNMSGATVQSYPGGSYLETHAQYDQCGNLRKGWDANGKLAETFYADAFSDSVNRNTFAYPTSGTTPVPDPSGYYASNQAFTSGTVYDFNTGKVVSTTDANNQTTTYSYRDDSNNIDPLLRLRKVTLPAGLGETKYEFGDTPGNLYARTRTKQNATTWLDDYTYFDKLGRPWRSGHYEAANSWSVKDTEYDTLGRVWRVSNPYLAANLTGAINPPGVWTTTTYDDLNRVLTVTTPDGSKVETIYSGVQVTVKDATNKQRRSVTDGLGRLKQVVEDPAGTPLQTDYTYDTLGNLTVVNQGGQYRYFFYDSLSRLARAKNPEQDANSALNLTNPPAYNNNWSLGYAYDSNGNLTSRVDARNITTGYGYDALSRNIWASYNDGVTPTLERHYDPPISNGKGRFYYHVNYTQNPATGTAGYSRLIVNSYDAIGRVTAQTQGFLANDGVTWKDYQVSRTYNLASQMLTQSYPSGRSVTYSYGASGRLASANGNLGGTSYTYADTISYNAAGQMTKERFGTATNLYHNLHYNNRHQLVDIRLGDSSSDEWNWSRGALVFYYGTAARDAWNPFANSTDNNGNVLRQLHYVPLSGGGYVLPQLDDYTYDSLNRIASVTEAQLDGGGSWTFGATSQTFTYDRWGNRTSVTGHTAQSWSATEAAATNRLKLASGNQCTGTKNGLCYDAAGNLVFDNQLGATGDRSYDAEGRIVTAAGGGLNKYVYDADGKRVRRQVGAQQFWQVYGIDGELIAEYEWNGTTATLLKEYGSGGGASVVAEGATVRWLVMDHLGTPRMIADQTGSLSGMRRHDYLPFGEENFTGATIRTAANGYQAEGVRQKFGSKERDTETGLDWFGPGRYFASVQGRFTSVDPLLSSGDV
ncbi:MAG: RHS repeat domain-containing protein, partial [Blastocatellales bacterium]